MMAQIIHGIQGENVYGILSNFLKAINTQWNPTLFKTKSNVCTPVWRQAFLSREVPAVSLPNQVGILGRNHGWLKREEDLSILTLHDVFK